MAFNKMMHPRNPYKDRPPDFKELAQKYSEFRSHCFVAPNGKLSLNFRSSDAVRCLARAMLHNDFGLDVELPNDCLVPRIPQRLNYILFIDDLLSLNNIHRNIIGIDIGTGASCIYALLGAKQCGWRFFATESDQFAAEVASNNVRNNELSELIEVVKVREDRVIKDIVRGHDELNFTFCMCNPPFYGEDEAGTKFVQLESNNAMENKCYDVTRRAAPRSATIGRRNELSVSGGEVGFVSRLIDDSLVLQKSVKFYTSMVGKKSSLNDLTKKLKKYPNLIQYAVSTLSQGRTQRWVLTWSFDTQLKLSLNSEQSAPLNVPLPLTVLPGHANECYASLKRMLDSLQINYTEDARGELICEATRDSWSQQRHKKRMAERKPLWVGLSDEPQTKRARYSDVSTKEASVMVSLGRGDGRDSLSDAGNFSASSSSPNSEDPSRIDTSVQVYLPTSLHEQALVRFGIAINAHKSIIELRWIDGSRHSLHQISQYIRNHSSEYFISHHSH